eukprot:COSAG01_NODE_6076_length_3866_cov_3.010619_1_plen_60_part_00
MDLGLRDRARSSLLIDGLVDYRGNPTRKVSRAIYEYLEEIVLHHVRLYMGLDLELSCII